MSQPAWVRPPHADDVIDAAVALATFIASSPALDVRPTVRREALRLYVLSLVTQGTLPRRGLTRFVSRGAAAASRSDQLEHEHVFTRKYLSDLILLNPSEKAVRWILENLAIAATVTKNEHVLLTRVPGSVQGWERYTQAGVEVTDLTAGKPVSQAIEIPKWIRQPGDPEPEDAVSLPNDALDRFLGSEALQALLDPAVDELRGATDWPIRRAEALEAISIVSHASGRWFSSREEAKTTLFANASGGGFGIRDWLQDAILAL